MNVNRRQFLKRTKQLAICVGATGIMSKEPTFANTDEVREQFFRAVQESDLTQVDEILTAHPEVIGFHDKQGRSGFTVALLARHARIAQRIRDAGYQPDLHESALALDWDRFAELTDDESPESMKRVNECHPLGGAAMYAAAYGGAGSDIWRVYSAGGMPNDPADRTQSCSPLQAALSHPDLATAEITAATLLANAANPNGAGEDADPPLCIAARRGSLELVEMLVRLGADPKRPSLEGTDARELAQAHGHEAIASRLDRQKMIPRSPRSSRTTYDRNGERYQRPSLDGIHVLEEIRFVGASHFDLDAVTRKLREEPRLVHSVATTSEICVEACAHTGRRDIVELLLQEGAPYSLPTAAMMGDLESIQRRLKEDPNRIHERGAHDFPLLWYPIIGQAPIDVMDVLIAHGAEVEQQHFLGTTALHWACRAGRIDLVEYLLAHQADPTRVGRKFSANGQSPAQLASGKHKQGILDLLKKASQE